MKNREKLIRGYHIKVNKKQQLLNITSNFLSNDLELINDHLQNKNSPNNAILTQIPDDINQNINKLLYRRKLPNNFNK